MGSFDSIYNFKSILESYTCLNLINDFVGMIHMLLIKIKRFFFDLLFLFLISGTKLNAQNSVHQFVDPLIGIGNNENVLSGPSLPFRIFATCLEIIVVANN